MSDHHSTPSCSYLHALWLNNSAARHIENGEHERAISFLLKALELNPAATNSSNKKENKKEARSSRLQESKTNDYCTLDDCILSSERARSTVPPPTTNQSLLSCSRSVKTARMLVVQEEDTRPPMVWTRQSIDASPAGNDFQDGYIYCQPIRVSNNEDDANIGETLVFIIIFNLALAHHLEARLATAQRRTNECQTIAEKARLLYELAHNGYTNHCNGDPTQEDATTYSDDDVSIRFILIIQNNLCQLFRLVKNHQTYELFRQHLVSTVMAVIEYNTRVTSRPLPSDMGGFLNNIASLVLGETACAEAA